jgi:hypothetical protein
VNARITGFALTVVQMAAIAIKQTRDFSFINSAGKNCRGAAADLVFKYEIIE